ncbi:hypothetical protein INT44_004432 [Umbelopsis vinacea]|uniref:Heterokaryon incompatibility domain-containing protein n=1 Tax=Umbelopsis vinacea TaxID=44442 RepID=A0A8H7UN38_9FUNG|nr:hypothetical protein INT44_004432 [Umbelopsis vinacea]
MTRITLDIYRNAYEHHATEIIQSIKEESNLKDPGDSAVKSFNYRHRWFDAAHSGCIDEIKSLVRLDADIDWGDEQMRSALHICAAYGHKEMVSLLIDLGITVDIKDENSSTALHLAAWYGKIDIVSLLLDYGANIESKDNNSETALHMAISRKNRKLVQLLLNHGACVHATDGRSLTPLHIAACSGQKELVSILLDIDADVEAITLNSRNALILAAENGHTDVVRLLLNHDIGLDATTHELNFAFQKSASNGHKEVAHLLLKHGAAIGTRNVYYKAALHEAASNGHKEVVHLLLNYGVVVDAEDQNLHTALYWASSFGHKDVVNLLLDFGVSADAKHQSDDTALSIAALNGHQEVVHLLLDYGSTAKAKDIHPMNALVNAAAEGHKEIVHMLLEHGVAVDARNSNLQSALHMAALLGHYDVAHLLLDNGAAIDAVDIYMDTALHNAASQGKKEVVRMLLDHGAAVDAPNAKSDTALHVAARYGHKEVVTLLIANCASIERKHNDKKPILAEVSDIGDAQMVHLLLDHDADIEALDCEGQTVFITAAKANQLDMVSLLLKRGANIEARDKSSLTALHLSAKEGNNGVLELLLKEEAHIEATTKQGNTALHFAAEFNHFDILSILLKYGAYIDAENEEKITPIHVAIQKGHIEIVYYLKNAGATINGSKEIDLQLLYLATDAGQVELVSRALEECNNVTERLNLVDATLRRASQSGQIDVVSYLLDNGANIEDCDDDGFTPLFLAGPHPEMISTLIHCGACMEARNAKNRNQSVLHHLTSLNLIDAIRILLNCGCNIHLVDDENNTVLHYASDSGQCDLASLLLTSGVDINAKNENGDSALHIATMHSFYDLSVLLVNEGADIDAKNDSGSTALHFATEKLDFKLVSLLLMRHANVDITNEGGRSALHIAVMYNFKEGCALMIEHGADVNLMDDIQWTPLHIAMFCGNPDLVTLLLDHGASVDKSVQGRFLFRQIVDSATFREGFWFQSRVNTIITSIIKAGTDTTGMHISEEFKKRFPAVVDLLNKNSGKSISKEGVNLNPSSKTLREYTTKLDPSDVILREYRGNISHHSETSRSNHSNEILLILIKHKYGYGFPLSRTLQLDGFQTEDRTTDNQDISPYSQSLKNFKEISLNERAIAVVETLFNCFEIKLFISDNFFMLESERCVQTKPPAWASLFDKMMGVVQEPGRMILQIPSKITPFSVTEWHENTHPYLRFINAVYVCRRSSKILRQEDFSAVLGGSEQMLAVNLHAILIAGLSILAIAGSDGLVEKLVMAIVDIKPSSILTTSSNDISTKWQVYNRRQCPCQNDSIHRPLSPVAAAKAVGIDIWRNRQKQILTRVWDLQQDKLVKNVDARNVIFITHRWDFDEKDYSSVQKKKLWKGQSISRKSDKLRRIRKALMRHIQYVWIDTICIDKSNLSELDEAIRSMYKWYASCAAVVLDSGTPLQLWCKRGWCLQEGAAAGVLRGISREGDLVTIQELANEQHQNLCTLDLHLHYLQGNAAEILVRMNIRETTRDEDMAYALTGIFSIHMELAYGEGNKARGRLFRQLAIQKGDLSFLCFQTTPTMSQFCLPPLGEPSFLIAKCTKAPTSITVSHLGICFEVQLIKGQERSQMLQKLQRWKSMSFAKGRYLGVDELIEAEKKLEHQSASSIALAVVRHIRSLMLVETYDGDLQTNGSSQIKLCYRLQCCQIEENEFLRLFGRIVAETESICLGDKPDGAEMDQFEIEWSGRRGI